jgi:SanA protein
VYKLRWLILAAAVLVGLVAFPFLWHTWVNWHYAKQMVALEQAPAERIAIVFGARVYANGSLSSMTRDRVETAVALYKAGKVQKLLISGDNSNPEYDEPGMMMAYAIAQGVPAAAIQPDYGGRRTYDTCYRAQAIFQVERALLITQAFHLPRALFLCQALGIQATGVIADRQAYAQRSLVWSQLREIPATLAALMDIIRRAPPPVLGEPIPIS